MHSLLQNSPDIVKLEKHEKVHTEEANVPEKRVTNENVKIFECVICEEKFVKS